MIEAVVQRIEAREDLSMDQMCATIGDIMAGAWADDQIARLLVALNRKGPTVAEVAGAAAALRRGVTPIRTRRTGVIDTCGTGGDEARTFNISTAAALVVGAAGVPVAKHGNRGVSSRSGSADVLAVLGVNIEADVARVEACLDDLGICFCFAPLFHTAMKRVAAVRKGLGVPTIFNLLGPLVNPAGARFQLIGVGRAPLRPLVAEALAMLGVDRAVVVHGEDGLDEVTLGGRTQASEVCGRGVTPLQWTPEHFGLGRSGRETLLVAGPEQSAAVIRAILEGHRGPQRDVVVANAAAALWTAGVAGSLLECAGLAAEAIDNGAARRLLRQLVDYTNR
jgi:anthranilate phosphoribosyltransferase